MAEGLHETIERMPRQREAMKSKRFYTSTPYQQHSSQAGKLNTLSCSTVNDSGLGASPTDLSVSTPTCDALLTLTTSVCTPKTNLHIPHMSGRNCELSNTSPRSSRKYSRRSLDSACSLSRSDNSACSLSGSDINLYSSGRKSLDATHDSSRLSRSHEHHFVRRLDLDLDIYDNQSQDEQSISGSHNCISLRTFPSLKQPALDVKFQEILDKFSPDVPDRLIGRRMGKASCDIISQLNQMNVSCVASIFTYLAPEDLCSMCLVSRSWKGAVEHNRKANQRRRCFLKQHRVRIKEQGKENAGYKQPSTTSQLARVTVTPLQSLALAQPHTDDLSERSPTVTEQFIQAASGLKNDEKLQKCPRCRKPAKVLPVQDRGKCQNLDCKYDFCTKCSCEFHQSKVCTPITTKKTRTDAVGSTKSKRNLKRL